jgi:hypothetical protein
MNPRGLVTIQRELRASGASLHPQPVEGTIAGQHSQSPCLAAGKSGQGEGGR